MGESAVHQQLVKLIISDIIDTVGKDNACFIMSDVIDNYPLSPLTNEGFRPDVYYQYDDILIIGEAKTSADISRPHSIRQYSSYMRKCSLFIGNATFIIAVPWLDHATAHNILHQIKKEIPGSFKIKILDGIGGAI